MISCFMDSMYVDPIDVITAAFTVVSFFFISHNNKCISIIRDLSNAFDINNFADKLK